MNNDLAQRLAVILGMPQAALEAGPVELGGGCALLFENADGGNRAMLTLRLPNNELPDNGDFFQASSAISPYHEGIVGLDRSSGQYCVHWIVDRRTDMETLALRLVGTALHWVQPLPETA